MTRFVTRPATQIDLFEVEEELLVEESDVFQDGAANQHAAAGDPLCLVIVRLGVDASVPAREEPVYEPELNPARESVLDVGVADSVRGERAAPQRCRRPDDRSAGLSGLNL